MGPLVPLLAMTVAASPSHVGGVTTVDFRPDGQVLATGGWDNTIKIWLVSDGKLRRTLRGHTDSVRMVRFSPDGKWIASAGADGTVRIWSGTDSRLVRTIRAGTSFVSGVGWGPSAKTVWSSGYDNRLKRWDRATGRLQSTFSGLPSDAYGMAVSDDGLLVAGYGPDSGALVWEPAQRRPPTRFPTVRGDIGDASFAPDGRRVAFVELGRRVWVCDPKSGAEDQVWATEGFRVWAVAWSEDGSFLYGAGNDGVVHYYSLTQGELGEAMTVSDSDLMTISSRRDGAYLAVGDGAGWAYLIPMAGVEGGAVRLTP